MIKLNLVENDDSNHCRLTIIAKSFVNQIEAESSWLQKQAKISLLLVYFNQKGQVLFYNTQGFSARKVR